MGILAVIVAALAGFAFGAVWYMTLSIRYSAKVLELKKGSGSCARTLLTPCAPYHHTRIEIVLAVLALHLSYQTWLA